MNKIKAIIFDLGGVLLNLNLPQALANMQALGVGKNMMYNDIIDQYQTGSIASDDFISRIMTECQSDTDRQQVTDAWNSCLLDIPEYKLQYILQLRERGFRTYLLSNTNDIHWRHIVKTNFPLPVTDYFDALYLSHEMHLLKPDKAIYTAVLSRAGMQAEECLFLDDTAANIQAAATLGIMTYLSPICFDWRKDISTLVCSG